MLLTLFLAIVFCVAISLMMLAAVAFIRDKKMFSSAPKEFVEVIEQREGELFYGARAIGWTLMIFSFLLISGTFVIAVLDGVKSDYTLLQFFLRFYLILAIYKLYDMICFDYYLLIRFRFFQYYFPEIESVSTGRKYGFNIKSQLIKLFVVFPIGSALVAWICTIIESVVVK